VAGSRADPDFRLLASSRRALGEYLDSVETLEGGQVECSTCGTGECQVASDGGEADDPEMMSARIDDLDSRGRRDIQPTRGVKRHPIRATSRAFGTRFGLEERDEHTLVRQSAIGRTSNA
jgi:hypothetical protein